MGDQIFESPVYLRLNTIGNYQARSAREALEYLDLHWPTTRTAHYRHAKTLCEQAAVGAVDTELARLAVIDAAQRSGILEYGWKTTLDGARVVFRVIGG